jgi:hypothetical protein
MKDASLSGALFSTVQQRVLALIFGHPERSFYTSEIVRSINSGTGAVEREPRLHRQPPAEADIQQYFGTAPPSVHQMVLTLVRAGLIRRQPGTARSIEVLVDPKSLPELI